MNLLNFEHIQKNFGTKRVLDDVVMGIEHDDKIGIVGINGAGKSTLLSIAAGMQEPDEGQIVKGREVRISFLPQIPVFNEQLSIAQNIAAGISGREEHWDVAGEVRTKLKSFGIEDPDQLPSTLSGGQRKRAALIGAILTPCDLLILDEPTNHLDSRMIEWLEKWLQDYKGALLLVTHDRYFLDRVTNQILEIDGCHVYRYRANYSGYLEEKQNRLDRAAAHERKLAALYRQDLAWMQRGARARSTKQKAHIRRFEALASREKLVEERQLQLSSMASRMGNKTIEIRRLGKSMNGRMLFRDFTYTFLKTDRIGIVGPNGCGKTTLLRCITGELQADEGTVETGQTIRIGYFGQENEGLPLESRVIDFIRETAEFVQTADGTVSASSMCERFLFDGDMQYSVIGKLSGGEKRRLSLLNVLMTSPNVLVLDEPTNDLDIQTLQILEDYLDHFAGILLVVSHDRYFLDRCVTRIFAFQADGLLWQSEGGYSDYRIHCEENGKDLLFPPEDRQSRGKKTDSRSTWKKPAVKKGLSFTQQKEYDHIEEEIEELEMRCTELDTQMAEAATDFEKLAELSVEKDKADKELEEKMERFLFLQEIVDAADEK